MFDLARVEKLPTGSGNDLPCDDGLASRYVAQKSMTHSKSIVLLGGIIICALLAVVALVLVRAAVSQDSYEGYFAPVYSADGEFVYYIERRSSGDVRMTTPPDIFFSAPKYNVSVAKDSFTLKRLHIRSRKIEELAQFSPSPLEGQRYDVLGSPFHGANARLRFTKEQQLEFEVCLTTSQVPRSKEYLSSGVWNEEKHTAEISQSWKETYCQMSGYDEWPLFGASELMAVHGDLGYSPAAIIAYNHDTSDVKVLVKNDRYDRIYPDGVPLQKIRERSLRAIMQRDQAMRRTHAELMQRYKAQGMTEIQASLRTGKDMQRLGYYPKTPTLVARRLTEKESSEIDKNALFSIAKGEMESGIFQDIERAIAKPGEEVDKDTTGRYLTHRDYSTSARLNAFLNTGTTRFYVRYLGNTYELTINRP